MFHLKIARTLVLLDISRIESAVRLFQVADQRHGVLLVVKLAIHAETGHVFDVAAWRFRWLTNAISLLVRSLVIRVAKVR